jgi:hypothetical protein
MKTRQGDIEKVVNPLEHKSIVIFRLGMKRWVIFGYGVLMRADGQDKFLGGGRYKEYVAFSVKIDAGAC